MQISRWTFNYDGEIEIVLTTRYDKYIATVRNRLIVRAVVICALSRRVLGPEVVSRRVYYTH